MIKTCIILAGGLGTRLSSVLRGKPKCLAPVGEKSFIEIQLNALKNKGIASFILSLGHKSEMVTAQIHLLGDQFDIQVIVEDSPLGTGGAILNAMSFFNLEETLVSNGDTYLNGNIESIFPILNLDGCPPELGRIAITPVLNTLRYGEVVFQEGVIKGFLEKNQEGPGLINAGLYHLHRKPFESYLSGEAFSLEHDILPKMVREGLLRGVVINGDFIDIGVPDDYFKFCEIQKSL